MIKAPTPDPRFWLNVRPDQWTDLVVIREIWSENVYEVFSSMLEDTGIVVDIGANIGAFSIYVASMSEEVKVYAYEPQPDNYDQLISNINLNKLQKQVLPFKLGVSSTEGVAYITDEGGGSRLTQRTPDTTKVDLTTLKKIWDQNNLEFVDILKVDVEGHEYDILLAAPGSLFNLCRYIVIEFDNHDTSRFGDLIAKLTHTHQVKIVGSTTTGGYIFCHRY